MRIIIISLSLVIVTGCANTSVKQLNNAGCIKNDLINVGVSRSANRMHFSGPMSIRTVGAATLDFIGDFAGQMGAIVPFIQFAKPPFAIAAEALRLTEIAHYQTFIEIENNIRIEQIINEELNEQIKQTGKLRLVESPIENLNFDTLNIEISHFGFDKEFFSYKMIPGLAVSAGVVDGNGEIACLKTYKYSPHADASDAVPFDQFNAQPERIKESWKIAARALITDIVKDLMASSALNSQK